MPWQATVGVVVLTLLIREGIGGIVKIWGMKMAGQKQKRDGQDDLIERLTNRVDVLESKLSSEQNAHMECVRKMGVLEGKVDQLSRDLDQAIQRHDRRNDEHVEVLKAANAKLEDAMRAAGIPIPEMPWEKPAT